MSREVVIGQLAIHKFEKRVALVPFSTCHYWTGAINDQGYGVYNRTRAHRIAYEAANGPIPASIDGQRAVIRHKCDTPLCVNPDHLEIGTQAQNMADKADRDRAPMCEGHYAAKLREGDAEAIIAAVNAGERVVDVAARYSITPSRVSMIRYGHSRWVDGVTKPTGRSDRQISDELAVAIYAAASAGAAVADIARRYGVSKSMVYDIRRGNTYASVTGAGGK